MGFSLILSRKNITILSILLLFIAANLIAGHFFADATKIAMYPLAGNVKMEYMEIIYVKKNEIDSNKICYIKNNNYENNACKYNFIEDNPACNPFAFSVDVKQWSPLLPAYIDASFLMQGADLEEAFQIGDNVNGNVTDLIDGYGAPYPFFNKPVWKAHDCGNYVNLTLKGYL